jgi:sarcosine oxidase subunit alpha
MRVEGVPNVRTCIAPLQNGIHIEMQGKFADLPDAKFKVTPKKMVDFDILVVGAGPAGLCASIEAAKQGAKALLVDENLQIGGQLIKQTHKFFGSKHEKAGTRGIQIAKDLEEQLKILIKEGKIDLMLNSTVIGYYEAEKKRHKFAVLKRHNYDSTLYEIDCKGVIFACGAMENMLLFPGNDLPGVYGAGAVQTLMNVYGVKPGDNVIMVGAGNVGLIISYQLLQAGIKVDRVVEAAPNIGGYHVHAAKLRRCGVPILTSHSIKEVLGKDKIQGAIVVKLDKNWQPIKGTEEKVKCDTICLAVGLTPSIRLLSQVGVKIEFVPEAGGYVALHDDSMQTTATGVYVSGDSSGIEEASTAMIEGKIAGVSAALQLGYNKQAKKLKIQYINELDRLRAGPFGEKPRIAKKKIEKLLEIKQ